MTTHTEPQHRHPRSWPTYLAVAAIVALTACRPEPTRTTLQYPAVDGPHAVGRTTRHWRDATRPEPFTADPADARELTAHIWYPAAPTTAATTPLLDAALEAPIADATGIPADTLRLIRVAAVPEAAPAPGARRPVILMSHAMAGSPLLSASIAERLASRGFVVVGVTHPYSALATVLSDGRRAPLLDAANALVPAAPSSRPAEFIRANAAKSETLLKTWVADLAFAARRLDDLNAHDPRLAGQLDLTRTGVFGHSFGGAAATRVMLEDPARFRAGANLDGSLFGDLAQRTLRRPFLAVMNADAATTLPKPTPEVLAGLKLTPGEFETLRPLLEASTAGPWLLHTSAAAPSAYARVDGTRHANFSDLTLIATVVPNLRRELGAIEPRRAQRIVSDLVTAFFEQHLAGAATNLEDSARVHAEVRLNTRNP